MKEDGEGERMEEVVSEVPRKRKQENCECWKCFEAYDLVTVLNLILSGRLYCASCEDKLLFLDPP